ncbi:hypothetical protein D3C72_1087670 [compost metagenome]
MQRLGHVLTAPDLQPLVPVDQRKLAVAVQPAPARIDAQRVRLRLIVVVEPFDQVQRPRPAYRQLGLAVRLLDLDHQHGERQVLHRPVQPVVVLPARGAPDGLEERRPVDDHRSTQSVLGGLVHRLHPHVGLRLVQLLALEADFRVGAAHQHRAVVQLPPPSRHGREQARPGDVVGHRPHELFQPRQEHLARRLRRLLLCSLCCLHRTGVDPLQCGILRLSHGSYLG